ncbi:MAG: alpha/beta hydrolase, partial [Pseudomonadales bacterium]
VDAMSTTFDNITMPTLFIAGEQDQIIGKAAVEAAVDKIPNAKVEWLARCGHFPQVERAEQFVWLTQNFLNNL